MLENKDSTDLSSAGSVQLSLSAYLSLNSSKQSFYDRRKQLFTPETSMSQLSLGAQSENSPGSEITHRSSNSARDHKSSFLHGYQPTLEPYYDPRLLRKKTLDYLKAQLPQLSPQQFDFLVAEQVPLQVSPPYEKMCVAPSSGKDAKTVSAPRVPAELSTTSLATFQFKYFSYLLNTELQRATRLL
ncbi:hypothetical protein KL905_000825 [Ogataea polymorpha]|uniref:Uncharacterized protein n=1 Tax=Ogataea polymorpha TaxID=460523 RepID=A0A1B7SGP2_9ASCO|nr:uncharacterized protein OGAPODRAFT_8437 [Ogataea polymorpha]KAG7923607.1 hypothetical protein KL905_000825 [Ogataea polymorpha]KAG7933481.1 hypothetical protein KL934_003291 [Ogataea polymorpha]KAH3673861.1 hypothetical protein OGATHE_001841 [Ogataea polymorpha]OBA15636.1 hypothetical protein OGAPODRAFT_8437 [Ogataea polymorpha]